MDIIPAILTDDPIEARNMLDEIKREGRFKKIQVDFVDGEYNTFKTIMPEEIDLSPFLIMESDAHLMVTEKNLEKYVGQAVKVGFDTIIAQMESVSAPEEFDGLALDIHSPVEAIEPYLDRLKLVVVMAIEPGFGGQDFSDKAIGKIERLSELRKSRNLSFRICVDGGVEKEMLEELAEKGVDEVAVGARRVLSWINA